VLGEGLWFFWVGFFFFFFFCFLVVGGFCFGGWVGGGVFSFVGVVWVFFFVGQWGFFFFVFFFFLCYFFLVWGRHLEMSLSEVEIARPPRPQDLFRLSFAEMTCFLPVASSMGPLDARSRRPILLKLPDPTDSLFKASLNLSPLFLYLPIPFRFLFGKRS